MIRQLIDEAVAAGARHKAACELLGLTARTLERWAGHDDDRRHGPNTVPANKLSEAERRKLIAVATSPEFRDQSPKQIVPQLADRGTYLASESTLYRVLRAENMQHHRARSRPPIQRPHEHTATAPWQVASWDITYLRSLVRGRFFYLYLVEDVWSRKILGWAVHEEESAELAAELVERIRRDAGDLDLTGWVLHSDNGGPMKGATMLATLQRLGSPSCSGGSARRCWAGSSGEVRGPGTAHPGAARGSRRNLSHPRMVRDPAVDDPCARRRSPGSDKV